MLTSAMIGLADQRGWLPSITLSGTIEGLVQRTSPVWVLLYWLDQDEWRLDRISDVVLEVDYTKGVAKCGTGSYALDCVFLDITHPTGVAHATAYLDKIQSRRSYQENVDELQTKILLANR